MERKAVLVGSRPVAVSAVDHRLRGEERGDGFAAGGDIGQLAAH
jgi:hypothetical protein